LKKRFIIELILVIPDLNRKIKIEVNALDYIMEGMLSMVSIEYNNKEMLTVIRRLENWRYLLEDAKYKSKI